MRILKSLFSILSTVAIFGIISPQVLADEIITCKSRDYGYKHCRTDARPTFAEVHKQRSNTRCKKGRNWDYDRDGVWVDEGCGADFLVENDNNRYNNDNNNRYNNDYNNSNDRDRGETMYGITITRDLKRNSNDYKSFISGSLQMCARQCSDDRRCKSFNYGKAKKDCHLKDNVVDGVRNSTVVSGIK